LKILISKNKEIKMEVLQKIDYYYKNCDDVTPTLFIDENDLELYKENEEIIEYSKRLFDRILTLNHCIKSEKRITNYLIVCYVLCIKFYTDCFISSKPYSFINNFLEIKWLNPVQLSRIETKILKQIDYKFD